MPYTSNTATPRADIYALVMEANTDFNKLFIGDIVFPIKSEDAKRGVYMKLKKGDGQLLNADNAPRESGSAYKRINRKYDVDVYDTQEYGLETIIDDSYEEEVSRFLDLEQTEAMLLDRNLRISYEKRVALYFANNTTFPSTAASFAYTAANLATMDVAGDVDNAKAILLQNGIIPNCVIMSYQVFQRARRSVLLQNQIYGVVPRLANQRMLPGTEDVARALGIDNLYIGQAPVNSAQQGETYVGSFVWSNAFFGVGNIASGDYRAGGMGRTIQWAKDTTGLFTPETYRNDDIRSNILRVRQNVIEKVIDATAVQLIQTNYA